LWRAWLWPYFFRRANGYSDLTVFGRTLGDSSKRLIFRLYAAGSVFAFNQGNTGGGVKCV